MKTHKFIKISLCVLGIWFITPIRAVTPVCTTTCPGNMTVNAPANSCSAVVNYPAITSDCPVTTVPSSGSTFPNGTTTVNVYNGGCDQLYYLSSFNHLFHSNTNSPGSGTSMPVTGVLPGEFLRGLDFRPATGQLYSIGTDGINAHLYTINPATAVATVVGPGFPLPPGTNPAGRFGFDFNPVTDRIRLTSGSNVNVRIDPNTGIIVAFDTPFSNPSVEIQSLAYTNNYSGAPNTTLYGIDDVGHNLVIIGGMNGLPSPNSGVVTVVGPLGQNPSLTQFSGFDISACDNVGYLINNYFGLAELWRINLSNGSAFPISPIPAYQTVAGFTIQPSAPACTFNVTVTDNTPPQVNCPGNMVVTNGPNQCGATVTYNITATDNCSIQSLVVNPPSGSFFQNGTTTVTATATDVNGLTSQCQFTVTVNGAAPVPGPVSGPTYACKGQTATYCVDPIPGVTQYAWTLPAGATGTSTGNCITVSFSSSFNGGQICVAAINPCGPGQTSCKNLIVPSAKPAKPAPITGPASVCLPATAVFCIPAVPNTDSYVWAIGGNGGLSPATIVSGQGTTCVTVNFPAGYNGNQEVKVRASNCKGLSDEVKIAVKVSPVPNMPGNITGPASICNSQIGFYSISSVANATTYLWSVTSNVWIAGGQGTTSLALDFLPSTPPSATLSVIAQNTCGSSPARTKAITIIAGCKLGENESGQSSAQSEFDATVYPNPTGGKTTIRFEQTMASDVNLKVYDLTGRVVYHEVIPSVEGINEKQIDLTGLSKAIYVLRIEDGQKSRTMQLIIN